MLIRSSQLLPLLVCLWFGLVGCGPAYRLGRHQPATPELAGLRLPAMGLANGEARRP